MMEWRIAQADVINYSGDLMTPPDQAGRKTTTTSIIGKPKVKTIRGGKQDDSSDEDDW